MSTRRLLPALLAAALLLPAAAAHANPQQLSIMQDDDLLLYRDAPTREATLARMQGLGVDYVRVSLLWSVAAQNARSTPARLRRFKGNDPKTYPHGNWDKYDDLVRAAARHNIGVYFSLTGPGPSWAHEVAPAAHRRDQRTWKPKAGDFKKFVVAVGKRYSGTYRDENAGRGVLPRVSYWGLWNEPNQGGWLTPQYGGSAAGVIPQSPVIYRRLFLYGRQGLEATGHGKDLILLGETAPVGNSARTARAPIAPKKFLRELLCVDAAGHPFTGRAAKARDCAIFKKLGPLRASGYGHHPYTKAVGPTVPAPGRDSVTMANIGDLPVLLDRLAASTGRVPAKLPILVTEFGYETNPPDPYSGQPLDKQAEFLNVGDYIAYLTPRVYSNTQFILRDVAPVTTHKVGSKAYWFTYQSGLYFNNDVPKPSAAAYVLPFVAAPVGGAQIGVWGQLRFRPNGAQGDLVQIEHRPNAASPWTPAGDPIPVTNALNFFQTAVPSQGPGDYRAHWVNPFAAPGNAASRVVSLPNAAAAAPPPAPAPAPVPPDAPPGRNLVKP